MSQLFSHNAYGVLGLDSSASQKDVSRRSKDITNLLKIDEVLAYEMDINSILKIERTEATVKDAVQRLSSPAKRIIDYFFWFEAESEQDNKDIALLQDNQYDEALDDWKSRSEKNLTAKRNLAIASSLLLSHTGYKKYLRLSIDTWRDLLSSDRFWQHFEKVYALNDEIGTSERVVSDFRNKVLDYLSDFYTDVSRDKKDNGIYAAFSSTFGVKGKKVQDEVLAPIFEQINAASDQLTKLNVSEDNVLSSQESMAIRRLVKKIQDLFQDIKDLGLYEDSQTKVMRDKAAEAINIVAVDLFNNLDEDVKASALLKVAKSFAIGPAVISQINKNIDYIRKVVSQGNIIKPINDLIEKEQYQKALKLINDEQTNHKNDETLQTYFTKRIQWCVTALADKDFTEARRLFDAKNFEEAESWFASVYDFIYSYIEDFDINKTALDTVLENLRNKLVSLNTNTANDVDAYRNQVIESSNFDKETSLELPVMIMLLDSAIYQRFSQLIPIVKKQNEAQRAKRVIWNIIIWGAIIGFIAWSSSSSNNSSSGNSSSSSSDSSSTSAWQTCKNEYDSLKSQLDSIDSTMASYKAAGNTDAYNNLVTQQNNLVEQVNSKATECNNLR